MAGKWTPKQLKKFRSTMKLRKMLMSKTLKKHGAAIAENVTRNNSLLQKLQKPELDHTHQAIIYLRAANRIISQQKVHELTEAEVYGHLAYLALTERKTTAV